MTNFLPLKQLLSQQKEHKPKGERRKERHPKNNRVKNDRGVIEWKTQSPIRRTDSNCVYNIHEK